MPNTPNMSLPVNTVGNTATSSPQWAQNVNSAFSLLDQHTHASGSGVQITPAGLSISSDLSFISNNATNVRAVRMSAQAVAIPASGLDLNEIYVSGVDLYYNDGNGNQVRLTSSGGVAGTPGSIGGLTSPASATYVSATPAFVFQSAASTPANLDGGALTLRNISASSNGITISPPGALAANYNLTLPAALPAAQSFVTLNNSGTIATGVAYNAGLTSTNIATNGIARSNLPLVGQQVSASSGGFFTNSGTPNLVTNLLLTITTTGRPVRVEFVPDGSGYLGVVGAANTGVAAGFFTVDRDAAALQWSSSFLVEVGSTGTAELLLPPGGINVTDFVSAGVHTYKLLVSAGGGSNAYCNNIKMVVYEL